ncbi:MAG: tetratricopeptide repeat protein [Hyphomicrobiaceae bacterium]
MGVNLKTFEPIGTVIADPHSNSGERMARCYSFRLVTILLATTACAICTPFALAQSTGDGLDWWRQTDQGRLLQSEAISRIHEGQLASSRIRDGKLAGVEPMLKQSIEIFEKGPPGVKRELARSLYALSDLYLLQGRFGEAEPPLQRAHSIVENDSGPVHEDVARSLALFGYLYRKQGRAKDAEEMMRRALAMSIEALGSNHKLVAECMSGLADILRSQGRFKEAAELTNNSAAILNTRK